MYVHRQKRNTGTVNWHSIEGHEEIKTYTCGVTLKIHHPLTSLGALQRLVVGPTHQLFQNDVRYVAGDVAQRVGGRVGEHGGRARHSQHVAHSLRADVAQVHQHSQPVHLPHHTLQTAPPVTRHSRSRIRT